MWLSEECEKKYARSSTSAKQKLTSFPSPCLVECGFIAVADLLRAKRNQLEITKHGDLRLKWNLESKRYVISIKRRVANELA